MNVLTKNHIGTTVIIGLGLCPAIAVATTLQSAALLAIGIVFVHLFTVLLGFPLRRFVLESFSLLFVAIVASGFASVYALLCKAYFPETVELLSFYLYLIPAALPICMLTKWFRVDILIRLSARRSIGTTFGTATLLALVGALREIVGLGTIFNYHVFSRPLWGEAQTVWGGLVIVSTILWIVSLCGSRWETYKAKSGSKSGTKI